MKTWKQLFVLTTLVILVFAGITLSQQLGNPTSPYGPFVSNPSMGWGQSLGPFFQSPFFTFSGTSLVANYTAGSVYAGQGPISIVAGSVTLAANQTSCARPAFSACNFIYYAGSGNALSVTQTLSTAQAVGNTILALAQTGASGVTSFQAWYQDTSALSLQHLINRQAKFTASLSPAAVAANTCAEQLFTVTGVASGDVVVVNKPTAQSGLSVPSGRATSAGNQVGITFCNNTASSITPTASETYSFSVLQ